VKKECEANANNGRRDAYGEGKEFHILGADELKARERMTADSKLMKQVLVDEAQ
jgi:hypothetical protein